MLMALMSGKALTAGELAREAGVTLQTASSHLAKLQQGALVCLCKQGRHKYFTLAGDHVVHALASLVGLARDDIQLRIRPGPNDAALRYARVCYNHLAGEIGTRFFDSLILRKFLIRSDGMVKLSPSGTEFFRDLKIGLDSLGTKRSPMCRECLDWSERRPHLGGPLGRALLGRIEELGWAKRDKTSRALHFSRSGARLFSELVSGR
jgi:hypothetical protein